MGKTTKGRRMPERGPIAPNAFDRKAAELVERVEQGFSYEDTKRGFIDAIKEAQTLDDLLLVEDEIETELGLIAGFTKAAEGARRAAQLLGPALQNIRMGHPTSEGDAVRSALHGPYAGRVSRIAVRFKEGGEWTEIYREGSE